MPSDYWFDVRYGTDTMRLVELRDLCLSGRNVDRGQRYQATNTRAFEKLMASLDFPEDCVFVDLGSGKGKTLLMAAERGFHRVLGVEFSSELCRVAERNVRTYQDRRGTSFDIRVICSDVTEYQIGDDENVYFMYNPFDGVVMGKLLANLRTSMLRAPRRIWLIYNNPVYRDVLAGQEDFVHIADHFFSGSQFSVYISRNS